MVTRKSVMNLGLMLSLSLPSSLAVIGIARGADPAAGTRIDRDSLPHPVYKVANKTKNLKLFITEASFPNEQAWLAEASKHLTPEKLGRELKKLKPNVQVGIYHLTPGDRPVMLPQIEAIDDPRIHMLDQDARFSW